MAKNKSPLYLIWYDLILFKLFGKKYIAGIDITNKCNLRCRYCYHKKELEEEDRVLLGEWEERFKDYYETGIRKVGLIGGEPALRYDVIKLAEKYFPYVFIFTNGQIKLPEEFKRRIILSLDGLREEHDWNRGNGSFEKAVENYKGDKRVIVHCVLSKKNYKNIEEFIEEVKNMNVQGLMFSFYTPRTEEDDSLVLNKKEMLEMKKVLFQELKKKNSILYMAKEDINYLVKRKAAERCALKEKIYAFTADNKKKYCVTESADCQRCGCLFGCMVVPHWWNFIEAMKHKKMVYDCFFKLK